MLDHERRHFGDRPFECNICGNSYYRANVLKAHKVKCKLSAERKMIKMLRMEYFDDKSRKEQLADSETKMQKPVTDMQGASLEPDSVKSLQPAK